MVPQLGLGTSWTSFQPRGSQHGPRMLHSCAQSLKLTGVGSSSAHGDAITNHTSKQRPHPFSAKLNYLYGNSQPLIQLGHFLDSVPSSLLLRFPEWVTNISLTLLHSTIGNLFLVATLENGFFILELTHKGKQKKTCIMKVALFWPQFFQY